MAKKSTTAKWRVNTPAFLKEIGNNNSQMAIVGKPLMIFASILGEVAAKASELNDPQMNALMARLALYEITDPYSREYDKKPTNMLERPKPNGTVIRKTGKKAGQPYNYYFRQGKTAKARSKTFPGIAKAMASQWSAYLTSPKIKEQDLFSITL